MPILSELRISPNAPAPALVPHDADPLDLLVEDVRIVAASVFTDVRDSVRVIGAMLAYASELRSLKQPEPRHPAWTRAAMIVQLLVCSADGFAYDGARNAVARLDAFMRENPDLLDMS